MSTTPKRRSTTRRRHGRWSRRRLLGGLGAAAALAPLLPLTERESMAADDGFPRRLVLLFTPNGSLHERWAPSGTETDFELGPLLAPLEAFKDKMIVLDGLRTVRNGIGDAHQMGMGSLWTGNTLLSSGGSVGWAGGISVDQRIANAVGNDTPYRSLQFGAQTGGTSIWTRMCYAGPNAPLAPEDNPVAMFNRLFAGLSVDTSEIDRVRARRGSVIDLVKGELASLQPAYGSSDLIKLEAHLEAIRQVERRNDLVAAACETPEIDGGLNAYANGNYPLVCDQMLDQMVMSMACDLTRVASMQFSRSTSNIRFTWVGVDGGHHDISHYGNSDPRMVDSITAINIWYAQKVASLLAKMDAIPEGDGTLLDHSIVVWGNELSRGNSHGNNPVPFVIFGSGGGVLMPGRWLRYDSVPHNRLLVSLCHAMGLSSVQTFGNNDPGSGGLAGLT